MQSTRRIHDSTVVQLVDSMLHEAISCSASDIHLEPMRDRLRVRFRIDGVLIDQESIAKQLMTQMVSRLKVLANMNIAEKRVPQDGKFRVGDRGIDLRVSTFPSLYGEKMVVRILDRTAHTMKLDNLGFEPTMRALFKKLMHRQNGFFLVTGPTGSGKTTTLYAALSMLNKSEKNIVTLEDPVEYSLDGITQAQVNPPAGFTFERGIRSVLRQDPDIIMVGEIRDKQTARIAIEAAMTGHLVLSTLHTNNAPSAIMRLMDMGIEPFLINASLSGVLAQRLARTICTQCRKSVEPDKEETSLCALLGISTLHKGAGCHACNYLGYKGRTGIFELVEVSTSLHSLIVKQPIFDAIYAQAQADGMHTLREDAVQKTSKGIISLDECARIIL